MDQGFSRDHFAHGLLLNAYSIESPFSSVRWRWRWTCLRVSPALARPVLVCVFELAAPTLRWRARTGTRSTAATNAWPRTAGLLGCMDCVGIMCHVLSWHPGDKNKPGCLHDQETYFRECSLSHSLPISFLPQRHIHGLVFHKGSEHSSCEVKSNHTHRSPDNHRVERGSTQQGTEEIHWDTNKHSDSTTTVLIQQKEKTNDGIELVN